MVVDSDLSSLKKASAGVPQGSCLSPSLYSIFTNDVPVTSEADLALFADDVAFVTSSIKSAHAAKNMQRVLDLLPSWFNQWRLRVNVGKTQAMTVSKPQLSTTTQTAGPHHPVAQALQIPRTNH